MRELNNYQDTLNAIAAALTNSDDSQTFYQYQTEILNQLAKQDDSAEMQFGLAVFSLIAQMQEHYENS